MPLFWEGGRDRRKVGNEWSEVSHENFAERLGSCEKVRLPFCERIGHGRRQGGEVHLRGEALAVREGKYLDGEVGEIIADLP